MRSYLVVARANHHHPIESGPAACQFFWLAWRAWRARSRARSHAQVGARSLARVPAQSLLGSARSLARVPARSHARICPESCRSLSEFARSPLGVVPGDLLGVLYGGLAEFALSSVSGFFDLSVFSESSRDLPEPCSGSS